MDREILKGSLEIILLSLLKNNAMYGYEISKTIKNLSEDALIIGEGTLYPALKRLEEGKRELDLKLKDFSLIEKLIKGF